MATYAEALRRRSSHLRRSAELRARAALAPALSRAFLADAARRQVRYLGWTSVSLLLQVGEVAAIALVHLVYFPPESLELLRLQSALSLLGPLCAYGMRVVPARRRTGGELGALVQRRVLLVAQLGFCAAGAAAVTMLGYVALATDLHRSTPAIYRAVLLASVVGLPADVATTFLFHQLRSFPEVVLHRRFRVASTGARVLGLGAIALDLPSMFLVLALGPRLLVLGGLWRRLAGAPLPAFFRLPLGGQPDAWAFARDLVRALAPVVAVVALVEASLFVTFGRLSRLEQNLPLVLYLCHKLAHVTTVMGLRTLGRHVGALRRVQRLGDRVAARAVLARVTVAIGAASVLSLVLLPAALAKRDLVRWISPIGTQLDFRGALLLGLAGLVLVRASSTLSAVWLADARARWLWTAGSLALVAAPARWLGGRTMSLAGRHDVDDLLVGYVAADAAVHLAHAAWLAVACLRGGAPAPSRPDPERRMVGAAAFLRALASPASGPRALVLMELWPRPSGALFDPFSARALHRAVDAGGLVARWGRTSVLMLAPGAAPAALAAELRRAYAAVVRRLHVVELEDGADGLAVLGRLANPGVGWHEALYRQGAGRQTHLPRVTPDAEARFAALRAALEGDQAAASRLGERWHLVRQDGGWPLQAVRDQPARQALGQAIEALEKREEWVSPAPARRDQLRRVVYLASGDRLGLVALLDADSAGLVAPLRWLAFRHNLAELARGRT